MEKWLNQRTVFSGRVFDVRSGAVLLADGQQSQRDIVAHPGGVALVAEIANELLLVRQFRVAIGEYLLELPAGTLEEGDTPASRAAVELLEETGYEATSCQLLLEYYVSPGYTTEQMSIFHATGLSFKGQQLDGDEQVEVVHLPLDEARRMLQAGELTDSKTIIGLQTFFGLR